MGSLSKAFAEPGKRLPYGASALKKLYRTYKFNASTRNLVFSLTLAEFEDLTALDCVYCGMPPAMIRKERECYGEYVYNGVDRVDNTLGYITENCVPCCKTCNRAKGVSTLAEWNAWLDRVAAFRNSL